MKGVTGISDMRKAICFTRLFPGRHARASRDFNGFGVGSALGAFFDKLQDQRLDRWLKLLLFQRFSCDCLSSRVNSVSSHWISIPIFSYSP